MTSPKSLPFSKARRSGGLVFLSGEMPFDDDGTVPDGIANQTSLTLRRIAASLSELNVTLADVVNVTVHLTHIEDFAAFNSVYREHFSEPYPTRTTVATTLMVPAARIEITVVAEEQSGRT